MFDITEIRNEINYLRRDVRRNYEKLLNIYLRLVIEYLYMKKTDEDI